MATTAEECFPQQPCLGIERRLNLPVWRSAVRRRPYLRRSPAPLEKGSAPAELCAGSSSRRSTSIKVSHTASWGAATTETSRLQSPESAWGGRRPRRPLAVRCSASATCGPDRRCVVLPSMTRGGEAGRYFGPPFPCGTGVFARTPRVSNIPFAFSSPRGAQHMRREAKGERRPTYEEHSRDQSLSRGIGANSRGDVRGVGLVRPASFGRWRNFLKHASEACSHVAPYHP